MQPPSDDNDAADGARQRWIADGGRPRRLAQLLFGSGGDTLQVAQDGSLSRPLAQLPWQQLNIDLDDPVQRQFGDFELLARLGAGGMGVVYLARQRSLDRELALKLLSAGPWASADTFDRLRREAGHAARLAHPNIVSIFDVGEHDGLGYYTMRRVDGPSLRERIARDGALPPQLAVRLCRRIAEALDYAHRMGVLHLDIKPANILLDGNGEPHLADFGLARRSDQGLGSDSADISGTPDYMAPEQAVPGAPLTAAADIHALGATLFEALSGATPIDAPTPQETLRRLRNEPARPLRSVAPTLPRDLDAICARCLQHDPAQRYASAAALADDLRRFEEGRTVSVRPLGAMRRLHRWTRRQPSLAAAIGLGLAVLLAGILATTLQWQRAESNAALSQRAATAATEATWTARSGAAQRLMDEFEGFDALNLTLANLAEMEAAGDAAGSARERRRLGVLFGSAPRIVQAVNPGPNAATSALDANGELLAIASWKSRMERGDIRLQMQRVDSGEVLWRYPDSGHTAELPLAALRFSDDGRYLLSEDSVDMNFRALRGRSMRRFDALTGAQVLPTMLDPRFDESVFSADGRDALLLGADQAQHWQLDPPQPRGAAFSVAGVRAIRLGPAGAWALFVFTDRVELRDPRDGRLRLQLDDPALMPFTGWAAGADGRWIVLGSGSGAVTRIDTRNAIATPLEPRATGTVRAIDFSADGQRAAVASYDGSAFVFDLRSGRVEGPPIQRKDMITQLFLDGDRDQLVLGSFLSDAATVWQVGPAPYFQSPRPQATPRIAATMDAYGLDGATWTFAPRAGLLAMTTAVITPNDDLRAVGVRLYRLPGAATRPGRSPGGNFAASLQFDGEHYVRLETHRASVVAIDGDRALASFEHAGDVIAAELLGRVDASEEQRLLTLVGHRLHLRAWASNTELASIDLPGTPQRLALSNDGRYIALTVVEAGDVLRERILLLDGRSGRELARGAEALAGPLLRLDFSPGGTRLLALDTTDGLFLYDTPTLAPQPLPEIAATPCRLMLAAAVSLDDNALAVSCHDTVLPHLYALDLRTRVLSESPLTGGAYDLAASSGAIAWTAADLNGAIGFHDASLGSLGVTTRYALAPPGEAPGWYSAVDATPSLLALFDQRRIRLFDPSTREFIGPPLYAPLHGNDFLTDAKLRGDYLLARSWLGRQHVWRVAADARPLQQIRAEADMLVGPPGVCCLAQLPPDPLAKTSRRTWPERDPGVPPRPFAGAPSPVGHDTPPRDPHQLDLSPQFNRSLDEALPTYDGDGDDAAYTDVPRGDIRLAGRDFDVHGALFLADAARVYGGDASIRYPQRSAEIAVQHITSPTLHLLLRANVDEGVAEHTDALHVDWRYADGTRARSTLRTGDDIADATWLRPSYALYPAPPHVVWTSNAVVRSEWKMLMAVPVPNPHPGRAVAGLALSLAEAKGAVAVFAATLEK